MIDFNLLTIKERNENHFSGCFLKINTQKYPKMLLYVYNLSECNPIQINDIFEYQVFL